MPAKTKRTKKASKKAAYRNWQPKFLKILTRTANIGDACKQAGISRSLYYSIYHSDPAFAEAAEEAFENACDMLELEARRRAYEGVVDEIIYDDEGNEIGQRMKYSDTLMIFLLKAHRPEKYRENVRHEHTGEGGKAIQHEHEHKISLRDLGLPLEMLRQIRDKFRIGEPVEPLLIENGKPAE